LISPLLIEYIGWTCEYKSNALGRWSIRRILYPPTLPDYDRGQVTLAIIGDRQVGKKTLMDKIYGEAYCPRSTRLYSKKGWVEIDGMYIVVELCVGEEFLDYTEVPNVFLVCFAVNNLASFQSIRAKWFLEICRFDSNTPFILVGTKSNLRESGEAKVSIQQAEDLAHELGALNYFECSRTMGMEEVFYSAIDAGIKVANVEFEKDEKTEKNEKSEKDKEGEKDVKRDEDKESQNIQERARCCQCLFFSP